MEKEYKKWIERVYGERFYSLKECECIALKRGFVAGMRAGKRAAYVPRRGKA